MLAEPKYKVAWTLNPRGTLWANDSNKFGQKMLEKMGWSAGKGLGKEENGMTEPLKVAYKIDSKGLGFNDKILDTIQPLFDEYEKVLSTLSEKHATEPEIVPVTRQLKTRHRYHKLFKAKDTKSYPSNALASIFSKTPNASGSDGETVLTSESGNSSPASSHIAKEKDELVLGGSIDIEMTTAKSAELDMVLNADGEPSVEKSKRKKKSHKESSVVESSNDADSYCDTNSVTEHVDAVSVSQAQMDEIIEFDNQVASVTSDVKLEQPESFGYAPEQRKKMKKRRKLCGGYNVENGRVAEILTRVDNIIEQIEQHPVFSTSTLLHVKGYGSQK